MRFHTYAMGWSDSAVRRYVRDAGPLLHELNVLTRCDCTTRNEKKAAILARRMDELEERIAVLGEQEELAALRPEIDGVRVMEMLGLPAGPAVGAALEQSGIPWAFGGALALAYATSEPRGTRDVDVNVFVSSDHAVDVFEIGRAHV